MTGRRRLNNRGASENFDFECGGQPYACTFSKFTADNALAEVFIESTKNGSSADVASRDAAIAASFALQYGADADTLRRALCRDIHGKAQGPLATALDIIVGLVVVK
jgi:ribonucleoside-diphosphate reductase alpha chain